MLLVGKKKICVNLDFFRYTSFLPNVKYIGYKIGIQFSTTPLVVEENKCTTKTVNSYIDYDLASGYTIIFDGLGPWSFCHNFGKNVIIFGVDNSSSPYTDNHKNNLLVLGEGDTFGISGSFGISKKKFSITFGNPKMKFWSSFYYNGVNSYFFVNGEKNL